MKEAILQAKEELQRLQSQTMALYAKAGMSYVFVTPQVRCQH
jgi:hypothetical protein